MKNKAATEAPINISPLWSNGDCIINPYAPEQKIIRNAMSKKYFIKDPL